MKIYAIEVIKTDSGLKYYVYTCKFLSTRQQVDADLFESMREVFTVPNKNNNSYASMYFDASL